MIIELDFNSDKPIYTQLYEAIILAMASGEVTSGEPLPSVRNLASEIGINLHTVNKAYNQLRDEGYIIMDRRKGAIIGDIPIQDDSNKKNTIETDLTLILSKAKLLGYDEEYLTNLINEFYRKVGN